MIISISSHPFPILPSRLAKSPFKDMITLKRVLKKYERGEPIGFTARSSLKAMGLIPRAHGKYELGSKYK